MIRFLGGLNPGRVVRPAHVTLVVLDLMGSSAVRSFPRRAGVTAAPLLALETRDGAAPIYRQIY
ncbi:MAG: hypothetical protein ABI679_02825 [Gemmatimonadota bacterium]